MNTPTIKVILAGAYRTPHVVIQIGNRQTAAHTESYSTRSNGPRSWRIWAKIMSMTGHKVEMIDETVKPPRAHPAER